MSYHTLGRKEIEGIPAGRIMNTFIQEYVIHQLPSCWSNAHQKQLPCHWFEEHPRSCAEDDGGMCSADDLPKYSTDLDAAMTLTNAAMMKEQMLVTHTEPAQTIMESRFWASFYKDVPYASKIHRWRNYWASGTTMAMAICRAALLVT